MYAPNPFARTIKIVYYTHPLCRTSWKMQESWQRFVNTYNDYISFQFCLAKETADIGKGAESTSSSYLPCRAVKAASLQSAAAADFYLSELREAAMAEQRDISQPSVLFEVARHVNKQSRINFELHRFGTDFDAKVTRQALQADLQKIYRNRIDTFPTITMTSDGKGIKLVGLCSYQQLSMAMHKLLNMPAAAEIPPQGVYKPSQSPN